MGANDNYFSDGASPAPRFRRPYRPQEEHVGEGGLYLILFKDDTTCIGWIYPLRSKSTADVASTTKEFLADVGVGVKRFTTDDGTVFVNETVSSLCNEKTIHHQLDGRSTTEW